MKCVDCQEMLEEYALDALAPQEAEQVAEHLASGCADCQQSLGEVRESWAALAIALPPAHPPARVKAELLDRVRGEREPAGVVQPHVIRPVSSSGAVSLRDDRSTKNSWRWQSVVPFVAATLIGVALGFWFERRSAIDAGLVERYHAQLQQAERTFGAPQMRFAALKPPGDSVPVHGYLIWDQVAEELHIYAFDLGAPTADTVHRLWFVTDDDTWIPVGDLQVGEDGVCSAVIKVPQLTKPASRAVVTTEPPGGANADATTHGPIGLGGELL